MLTFILRKFFYSFFILFGVLTVTFLLNFVLPGDPARLMLGQRADEASVASLRAKMGLDKPWYLQYFAYVTRVAQFDLGTSFSTNRDVFDTIKEKSVGSFILAGTSMILATIGGIALGIFSALRPNSWLDTVFMGIAQLGISLPSFVVALMMILLFGVVLDWFPISGYIDRGWEYLVLPAFTLGIRPLSIIARVARSSMLDVLSQDYVRTARAKGLDERRVILSHALRNALNPVVTTVSSWFAGLLAGAFFIEYIFNWSGVGSVAINAIEKLDYPLIQGTVLFTAIIFVITNVVVDILYAFLDPRIKLQ